MHIALQSLLVVFLLFGLTPFSQAGSASVRPERDSYVVSPGVETAVVFRLENVTDVYGIDVRASFDPMLVEVIDSDLDRDGIQIQPGQLPQPDFVARQDVNPSTGEVRYIVTHVNPTLPASGSGVLFTVHLRSRGTESSSEFRIDSVEMADRDSNLLPVQWAGATLQVEGSSGTEPEPTSIIIVPASLPSPAATTPRTGDTPPAATAEPLPTSTQLPAAGAASTSAATMDVKTLSPTTAAVEGPAEIVKSAVAVDEAVDVEALPKVATAVSGPQEIVETEHKTDEALVAPNNPAVSPAASIANPQTAAQGTSGDTTGEATATAEAALTVIGEGRSVRNLAQAGPSNSPPEAERAVWPVILTISVAFLAAVGVVLISRRTS